MDPQGKHTYDEITHQGATWQEALDEVNKQLEPFLGLIESTPGEVIFTGCGSTYYLAQSSAVLYQMATGSTARAFPASEILINPEAVFSRRPKSQKILLLFLAPGLPVKPSKRLKNSNVRN